MIKELGGGSSQACASCKHQRKKCDETCELAPYFPASRHREFQNAHKLFGVSNILKIINSVEPQQRQAAAESIIKESNIRCNDPIHGCLGVVRDLQSQIELYEKELQDVNQQLAVFRGVNSSSVAAASAAAVQPPPSSLAFDYQAEAFNHQALNLPDVMTGDSMYDYQSTKEECIDVQALDVKDMEDQIMDPYQTIATFCCNNSNL